MPVNFPSSPTYGQTFLAPSGFTYTFYDGAWHVNRQDDYDDRYVNVVGDIMTGGLTVRTFPAQISARAYDNLSAIKFQVGDGSTATYIAADIAIDMVDQSDLGVAFLRYDPANTGNVRFEFQAIPTTYDTAPASITEDGHLIHKAFAEATYVSLDGDTMTGALTITTPIYQEGALSVTGGTVRIEPTSGMALLYLNAPDTAQQQVIFQRAGLNRWAINSNNTAETGSNAGTNLFVQRFSDAGSNNGNVLELDRASGQIYVQAGTAAAPSVAFSGDSDTGFYRSAANRLAFSTGGLARLELQDFDHTFNARIINVDGQVVGTSPGGVAQAEIRLKAGLDQNATLGFWVRPIDSTAEQRWQIVTVNVSSDLDDTTNVGSDLAIRRWADAGTSLGDQVIFQRSTGVTRFSTQGTTGAPTIALGPSNALGINYSATNTMDFHINSATRMTLTNTQLTMNVPIIMSHNSSLGGVVVTQAGAGDGIKVQHNGTGAALRVIQSSTGDALVVEDQSGGDTTPFIIKNDGKVGIGLVSPSEALEVVGNVKVTGSISSTNTAMWEIIANVTPSAVGAIDVTWTAGAYRAIEVILSGIFPGTVGAAQNLLVRVNVGGTFATGATDYNTQGLAQEGATISGIPLDGSAWWFTRGGFASATDELSGRYLIDPGFSGTEPGFNGHERHSAAAPARRQGILSGSFLPGGPISGLRFLWESGGTFAAQGRITVLGLKI